MLAPSIFFFFMKNKALALLGVISDVYKLPCLKVVPIKRLGALVENSLKKVISQFIRVLCVRSSVLQENETK